MKKIFTLVISVVCLVAIGNSQNVAINTDNSVANASALLDVKSTTKGMLIPRMTSIQRTAIVFPANGLMVYDITTNSFWFFNGLAWVNITNSGSGSLTLPFDGTANIAGIAFRVANSGNAIEGASTSGNGVYANSETGSGVNALSGSGYGIIANSAANSSIYAFSNNAQPTINATNSHATGVGIKGNSSFSFGILGTTGGVGAAGVKGEASVNGSDGVFGFSTSTNGVGIRGEASGTGTGVIGYSTNGTGMSAGSISGLALNVNGNVKIAGGTTNPTNGAVLTSDANGNAIWKNNRVAFRARGIRATYKSISSPTKVEFDSEDYDLGNNYFLLSGSPSSISSCFGVPVSGVYHFDSQIYFAENLLFDYKWLVISLKLERAGIVYTMAQSDADIDHKQNTRVALSTDIRVLQGDKIWIEIIQVNTLLNAADLSTSPAMSFFNGHLLFAD